MRSLLVARDGTFWIGTFKGLASWKDGKLTEYPDFSGKAVDALVEDRGGTIWATANGIPAVRLCAIQSGGVQCYGEDGRVGKWAESLYEDSEGSLWVGTATGLWRWKPGPPKHLSAPDLTPTFQGLSETQNRRLVVATRTGFEQLVDGKAVAYPLPGVATPFMPTKLFRDHDGGLWIGTYDRGLLHSHNGRADVFALSDGLSGDSIVFLFEDREGNVWVATTDGLDRFRDFAVATISAKQGLSGAAVWSLLAAADGSLWFSSNDGLSQWKDGQITIYRKQGARGNQSK